jgi:hypothetical protein
MAKPRKTKLAYALGVALPVAVLLGAALKAKKPAVEKVAEGQVGRDPGPSKD